MSPLDFLRTPPPAPSVLTGAAFAERVTVEPGDVVGVVMLELGGPLQPGEVVPFLESRLMDPVAVRMFVPRRLRPFAARRRAARLGKELSRAFEMIGGSSPLRRRVSEQAAALQNRLQERYVGTTGATFRTYVAMRYGEPSTEAARRRMVEDGVNKVVLLPLQPHFSTSTAGTSLAYWDAHGPTKAPTALVREYAAHPKLVAAINERIDEGLQRFPRQVRDRVQILFAAHGASRRDLSRLADPYCCHVHATVRAVMDARTDDRTSRVAFEDVLGAGTTVGPRLRDAVADAADDGAQALLVVPVSFLSERVDTIFDLDVTAREKAAAEGVAHFEVTSGLHCHPLVIDALAECVASHVELPAAGDGLAGAATPTLSLSVPAPRADATCPVCDRTVAVGRWSPGHTPEAGPTLPASVPAPGHRNAA